VRALTTKLRVMQKNPAKDRNFEEELAELERERNGLAALVKSMQDRDTFNFFTDEGLLPNYAFPEAGVLLRSLIYRKKKAAGSTSVSSGGAAGARKGGKQQSDASDGGELDTWWYEYERPAVSAIAELAPESRFYAGGRRVTVDRVCLKTSQVETWRFCDRCSHAELIGAEAAKKTCPRCGSAMWSDSGQQKAMVRMRTVYATTEDRQSRIGDDSDDREPAFFNRRMLVDFEDKHVTRAYKIDSDELPFGYDFLSRATFREINFGEGSGNGGGPNGMGEGEGLLLAGEYMPGKGFTICRHCGKVQNSKGEIRHVSTCKAREKDTKNVLTDFVFLYREFASEAIRILLPVTTFADSDRLLHSFMAALQLGLKKKFGGNIDHLQTTIYDEPLPDSNHRRRYLVLYDTVPGGTGYLKQLTRSGDELIDVLARALKVIETCRCRDEPDKDGCYRCLFAYRSSYHMNETSREAALELLKEISVQAQKVVEIASLNDIDVSVLIESELERRFLGALALAGTADRPVRMKPSPVRGKPGERLVVGAEAYDVEPQVSIGKGEGVSPESRADFVFWPVMSMDNESQVVQTHRPLAIFTDGWHYHLNRVGLDMAQRLAIAACGNYRVWSLTWRDVESRLGVSSTGPRDRGGRGFADYLGMAVKANSEFHKLKKNYQECVKFEDRLDDVTSFDLLMRYLQRPDEKLWCTTACVHAMAFLGAKQLVDRATWREELDALLPGDMAATLDPDDTEDRLYGIFRAGARPGVEKANLSTGATGPPLTLLIAVEHASFRELTASGIRMICRLDDEGFESGDARAEAAWRDFLRLYNLFQFLPNSCFVTESGIKQNLYSSPELEL